MNYIVEYSYSHSLSSIVIVFESHIGQRHGQRKKKDITKSQKKKKNNNNNNFSTNLATQCCDQSVAFGEQAQATRNFP